MRRILLSCALALSVMPLSAQQGPPPPLANRQLADPAQEARALELMQRLRCIQCQGQSIHDSDAPIAAAMRHEVRERIKAGQSEAEIESWLIERYGDWISYEPTVEPILWPLWAAPVMLLIGGAALVLGRIRRRKRQGQG